MKNVSKNIEVGDYAYINSLSNTSQKFGVQPSFVRYIGNKCFVSKPSIWEANGFIVNVLQDDGKIILFGCLMHKDDLGIKLSSEAKKLVEERFLKNPHWMELNLKIHKNVMATSTCDYFLYKNIPGLNMTWEYLKDHQCTNYNLTSSQTIKLYKKIKLYFYTKYDRRSDGHIILKNNNRACFAALNRLIIKARIFIGDPDTICLKLVLNDNVEDYLKVCKKAGLLPSGLSVDNIMKTSNGCNIYPSFNIKNMSLHKLFFYLSVFRNINEHIDHTKNVVHLYKRTKLSPLLCYTIGKFVNLAGGYYHTNLSGHDIEYPTLSKYGFSVNLDPKACLEKTLRIKSFLDNDPCPKIKDDDNLKVGWQLENLLYNDKHSNYRIDPIDYKSMEYIETLYDLETYSITKGRKVRRKPSTIDYRRKL